jgi:hypothetical protein
VIFIPEMMLDKFFIMIFYASIWIPQIITNTKLGYKNAPDLRFALFTSFHVAFVPLYFKLCDDNFMFLKPDYPFGFFVLFWILL